MMMCEATAIFAQLGLNGRLGRAKSDENMSNNPGSKPKNKVLLNRLRVLGDDTIVMMAIIG
jgi:hypothetical protein